MAAGRKQQQQQGVVVAVPEPSVARRMWRVLRAVLYMLRRGMPSGRKLAMDLHLLLHRGKIAGKALGDLLTFHHGHHRDAAAGVSSPCLDAGSSSFSCRALDPGLAVHEPSRRREVEFSCSNTPTSAGGLLGKGGRRRRDPPHYYYNYDAAYVARVFEMLNDDDEQSAPSAATPSPARLLWAFARSPAVTGRQLRVAADSPAAGSSDEGAQVDRKADEFIRRFYEQLRAQRSAASTPDYYASRRTPRAIAAGIA